PRVVLAGHSLGAYKAVTYMAACQDQRVAGVISASGPLRLWQRLQQDPQRLEHAERMVADGRADELLTPDPGGRITSAGTLVQRAKFGLDPYGIRDATNAPVSQIHCPILFVLGSEEPEIGRREDLPTLERNARSASTAETAFIEGADHVYRGREQ